MLVVVVVVRREEIGAYGAHRPAALSPDLGVGIGGGGMEAAVHGVLKLTRTGLGFFRRHHCYSGVGVEL